MSKMKIEYLEKILKEYGIENKFDDFLFGYQLSNLIAFSPLAGFNTKMFIFGISKNSIVLFPMSVSGSLINQKPVVLDIAKDILRVEFKKGILSHTLIIVTKEEKNIKYKISRHIFPYPWHNTSVKKLYNSVKV